MRADSKLIIDILCVRLESAESEPTPRFLGRTEALQDTFFSSANSSERHQRHLRDHERCRSWATVPLLRESYSGLRVKMSLVLMLVVLKNEEALEAKTIRIAERGASADDSLVRLCILHVSSSF